MKKSIAKKSPFNYNQDIQLSCYWEVDINGIILSANEVTGLNEKRKAVAYRNGDFYDNENSLQLGASEGGQLTIKWAIVYSHNPGAFIYHLWKDRLQPKKVERHLWMPRKVMPRAENPKYQVSNMPKVNIEVTLLDESENRIIKWNCKNCIPVEYQGPNFKADESAIAMQTLIVNFQTIESEVINWNPLNKGWQPSTDAADSWKKSL